MAELDPVSLIKGLGDPWTPGDANVAPSLADQMQEVWKVAHELLGATHKLPAPQAAAIVRWTGSTYVIVASAGINSIVRTGVGRVEVTLAFPMATPFDWIAVARGFETKDHVEGIDAGDPASTKTQTRTYVELGTTRGAEMPGPTDASFVLEIYGVTL